MKAVFIVFNQALTERVMEMLDRFNARGFSQWQDVKGRGTQKGEPHMGTHTWPALNSAILAVVDDTLATKLMQGVKKINEKAEIQGIRAFTWQVEDAV
ncbi:MAG: PG0541 family transporter-associated protein [Bacteroidota bacterium]